MSENNRIFTVDTTPLGEGMAQPCHPSVALKLRRGALPGQTFAVQTGQSVQEFQQFLTIPASITGVGFAQTAVKVEIPYAHTRIILAPPFYAENAAPNSFGYLCLDLNPPKTYPSPQFPEPGNYPGATGLGLINIPLTSLTQSINPGMPYVDLPLQGNRSVWVWFTSTGISYTSTTWILTRVSAINLARPDFYE